MADTLTKLNNLINPEVMADYIEDHLLESISFADLAEVDTTLAGTDGDTITLPKYAYIGDASDVGEGEAIDAELLTASSVKVKVKKAAKGISITDEAALGGYGDPIGEANRQLTLAIAQKVDKDCKDVLDGIGTAMTSDQSAEVLSAAAIAEALVKLGEMADAPKALIISPAQLAQLRRDPDYMNASEVATSLLMDGSYGMIWGCNILVKNCIVPDSGVFTNYIVMPGAVKIFIKRDTNVEVDRMAKYKRTDIYADKMYTAYLYDESKAVKLLVKA